MNVTLAGSTSATFLADSGYWQSAFKKMKACPLREESESGEECDENLGYAARNCSPPMAHYTARKGNWEVEKGERKHFYQGHFVCIQCLFPIPTCRHFTLKDSDKAAQSMMDEANARIAKPVLDYLCVEFDIIDMTDDDLLAYTKGSVTRWSRMKPHLKMRDLVAIRVLATLINRPRSYFNVSFGFLTSPRIRLGIWQVALNAGFENVRCQPRDIGNSEQFRLPLFVVPGMHLPVGVVIQDGRVVKDSNDITELVGRVVDNDTKGFVDECGEISSCSNLTDGHED